MPVITCLDDLRLLAKRRVPRMFYDYADSGSWTETTYRANESDFARILFRQRVMGNLANRSTAVVMAGQPAAMPVAIAPVGLTGMLHADGEIHAARAAEKFGIPFTLSTMSICSIEDVAANTNAPFWFQLYMMRDRDAMVRMIDRCKAAKCSALMVTVDIQVPGQRHKDLKNGMTVPPRPTLANLINLASRLRWCSGMVRTKRRTFGNLVGHVQSVSNIHSLSAWSSEQFDPRLCWDDISWIRRQWDGKLIVKGIMDAEDAAQAVTHGSDVVVVSNHGGRVLDHAPSSIRALPAIVDAIGHKSEVWMDGGIRTGQDVLKAWALGARGTLIGRAMVYGLGAMGEAGVSKALQILHKELDVTMAHCGHTDIAKVNRSILIPDTF
ncbi:alpha-hydroxy acid oxidase [Paraburkholderia fungorum]|uniref:Alpha-hydroxy-acid oxidizing enzyme n=1 Tax=Paraburkholderia fungorum TaxID=134537 RepID=A0A3R7E8F3_9BURK|nr:alpha-hydroxy acid oxidase [Paraburkholderia fungorum]RKF48434.1 alpha-hydroxy-acid oxidizing enzyme [Paraburkholderia fungorum]